MPRYLVELHKTDTLYAEVEVEAESEEQAKTQAYHMWNQDFDDLNISWDVMEENCQVGNCEAIEDEA